MNKLKKVDIKIFLMPFIIISLIFLFISHITVNEIRNYYYSHMKDDSLNYAKNYSQSLSKATEAYDVVNELLEDKMLVASRTAALYDGEYNNELLEELANTLEVDEIDYYNSQGELINSNLDGLVGWKAFVGHPVHDFMTSDQLSFIGNIRQDSITGDYFKYGYFKVSNGGFIQIGVRADKIQNFLGGFETQKLLEEMQEAGVVIRICLIDDDFKIVGSTEQLLIGQVVTNKEVKAAIVESREYGFIKSQTEENNYQVYVPVYTRENKMGTLAIEKSLKDTEAIVRRVTTIGIVTLITVYSTLLYTMITLYNKNTKLIKLAYYDSLTGLPNKQYLHDFLDEEIKKNKDEPKAMLLINCSDFRIVNMTYGFEYGDQILKEIGNKIQVLVDDSKMSFRFSADRFVLYIKNYDGKLELVALISKINQIFNHSFTVKDAKHYLRVEIGVIEINNQYDQVDRLFQDATISLNHIKMNDSVNYAFFNDEMEQKLQREDMVEKELRAIIAENNTEKLYLEFQPQIDLKTNKITCFEALARMISDNLGIISPLEFIDVAERKQLIVPLGNMLLKNACNFISTIKKIGYNDVKVAVNISGVQLLRDNFTNTVLEIIKETNIEESNIELEITESIFLDNFEIVNEKLKRLRDHKIKIALDDFGTGYSSFSRLRELNIDTLKIDQYFISKIPNKLQKEVIIGDIISMAHKLGLKVVAEGVEHQLQKNYLFEKGCDIMQGYLFSKSLVTEAAIEILKVNNKIEK